MSFPDNLPTGYAGDGTDFLKVKRDPFGAIRMQYSSITVADNASAGTTYGIVPFQKGFRLSYGSQLYTPDLDTASNVTLNVGYMYESSTASDADAFASAVSGQSAALITFDEEEGLSWVAEDDGWIVVALAAGPVTTEGTLEAQVLGAYDGLDSSN